jgi:hypothetical protein
MDPMAGARRRRRRADRPSSEAPGGSWGGAPTPRGGARGEREHLELEPLPHQALACKVLSRSRAHATPPRPASQGPWHAQARHLELYERRSAPPRREPPARPPARNPTARQQRAPRLRPRGRAQGQLSLRVAARSRTTARNWYAPPSCRPRAPRRSARTTPLSAEHRAGRAAGRAAGRLAGRAGGGQGGTHRYAEVDDVAVAVAPPVE